MKPVPTRDSASRPLSSGLDEIAVRLSRATVGEAQLDQPTDIEDRTLLDVVGDFQSRFEVTERQHLTVDDVVARDQVRVAAGLTGCSRVLVHFSAYSRRLFLDDIRFDQVPILLASTEGPVDEEFSTLFFQLGLLG